MSLPSKTHIRVEYTEVHDKLLIKYLATYCPTKAGRSGQKIFQNLVANPDNKWPFAKHHTWQSWRDRYVKNSELFDAAILMYQEQKHERNVQPVVPQKRVAEPTSIEKFATNAKRVRRKEEEESPSKETREAMRPTKASPSNSAVKSQPKRPLKPPETPTKAPQPTREPKPTHARHASTSASPARSTVDDSMSVVKKPPTEHTSLPTRQDTFEIPSSSPERQGPNPIEVTYSPHRHVKRIRVRLSTPSDIFVSEPPSPTADAVSPVAAYPRAPPRVVDSLYGRVLVDQKGHVPHPFPQDRQDGAEEAEDNAQWPLARGRAAKHNGTNDPGVEHHAFSQPQSQFLAAQVSLALDQRKIAAEVHPAGTLEGREYNNKDGASPIKRIVKAVPPSDPFARHIPKRLSKVFKFPAPRASTRSPFRSEFSPEEPQPRPPARTKAAHHPALGRVRRQTIGNGHEREHQPNVPSVDLVALSCSTMSSRSHSRSSGDASVPARRPRWSLPNYVHATPWMFDERGAPSTAHGDLWGRGHAGTSSSPIIYTPSPARSLVGTTLSAPVAGGFPTTPSAPLTPHPPDIELVALHGLASILARISANHGLALSVVEAVYKRVGSLREVDEVLKGMREAAEGFGEREIERRVRERRAGAERAGKTSVGRDDKGEHRDRSGNGKSQLRYVVASDDGEGSDYSPPETSRAAMWKRKSESAQEKTSEEEGDDDEEAEGREVEEELRNWDVDENDSDAQQDFLPQHLVDDEGTGQDEVRDGAEEVLKSKDALLEDTRFAQELERKLGRGRYRRAITSLFP